MEFNDLDIEITLEVHGEAVIKVSTGDGKVSAPLLHLVSEADDWLPREQMNTLYEELDKATSLARRLSRS